MILGLGSNTNLQFNEPGGIVRDPNSNKLYIVDTLNHRIVSYSSKNVVAGGNAEGYTNRRLHSPIGSVYNSFTKRLIIRNWTGHNVVR